MNKFIRRVKLHNFKRFQDISIEFNENLNVLIGDNESGKSTILTAIDLVLSGSISKFENNGLESLFNINTINGFLESEKKYEDLPNLYIELYLNDQNNKDLDGRYNSENIPGHGLLVLCEPRDDLSAAIKEILSQDNDNFPFEYYSVSFKTFSGASYSGYRKFMQHLLLDNTQINNEYATNHYIKTIYSSNVESAEKNKHENEYRRYKENFRSNELADLNSRLVGEYSFSLRTNSKSNLEADLTIREDDIELENKGKGKQCFIKADFALQKRESDLDIILLEEPENHLSHLNTKKLIHKINESENKQLYIATHSDLISTRLDLRRAILLNSNSTDHILLNDLSEETAKFFIKAPDNNMLEFILSSKVILVEGDSEFILMEAFYEIETSEKLEDANIHVISVGGTSFKRYLEIAQLLNIKTAVIRDNDGAYQETCIDRYKDFQSTDIKVFADPDNSIRTFEISVFNNNEQICNDLFSEGRRTLTVQEYMLSNKADCAYELLDKKATELNTPKYVKDAIEWIRQ